MLGGFLKSDVALHLKLSGVNLGFDENLLEGGAGVGGPAIEYWIAENASLVAGAGLGLAGLHARNERLESSRGLGVVVGGRIWPKWFVQHALGVYVDLAFIMTGGSDALVPQVGAFWKYY